MRLDEDPFRISKVDTFRGKHMQVKNMQILYSQPPIYIADLGTGEKTTVLEKRWYWAWEPHSA